MPFPSLLTMILFIQVIVSLNTLLHIDSPLIESAVSVEDVHIAAKGALSLFTPVCMETLPSGTGNFRTSEMSLYFPSDALL